MVRTANGGGKGLGRKFAPDERDEAYPMQAVLPTKSARSWRYHYDHGWWGDQGSTGTCVAFSLTHWLEDGPVTQPATAPIVNPYDLYRRIVQVDEWTGNDREANAPDEDLQFGTSVRAGAKVLQAEGYITEYRWAMSIDDIVLALLEKGPVVVGTNWYTGMFDPDDKALIKVEGSVAGGHAYIANGINVSRDLIRVKNSWGRWWGNQGRAWISISDMERLLREDGEAMLAVEVRQ